MNILMHKLLFPNHSRKTLRPKPDFGSRLLFCVWFFGAWNFLPRKHFLCKRLARKPNAANRSVVGRYRKFHEREVAIGAGEADNGNSELVCFTHRSVFVARIDDEKCSRQFGHRNETPKSSQQFLYFPIDQKTLALRVFFELALFALVHKLL